MYENPEDTRIKNGYFNESERISFEIVVILCDERKNSSCAKREKSKFLLDSIYWTLKVVEGKAELGNHLNYGMKPVRVHNKLVSQFVIDIDGYYDNNNFLRLN